MKLQDERPPENSDLSPRLALRSRGHWALVEPAEIEALSSEGNYTRFHLRSKRSAPLVRSTLKRALAQLDRAVFVQVYRSHAINGSLVRDVQLRQGRSEGYIRLESGRRVPLSRSYREEVDRWLGAVEVVIG